MSFCSKNLVCERYFKLALQKVVDQLRSVLREMIQK